MPNLYYIEYGRSISSEHLIVSANSQEDAEYYAYTSAQDVWHSYESNEIDFEDYPDATEEELFENECEEMELDIHYCAEPFDPENEEHNEVLKEQNNKPFEI